MESSSQVELNNHFSNNTAPEVAPVKSARKYDDNGWPEIKGNPISKVGVFPYSGAQIGHPELDPNKIYMVYRPEEELADEETINSFKLLPFTDEHAMLGSEEEGLMPAENKGIEGITGEHVYFDFPYLRSNLKIFSEKAHDRIESGKREISIGYRCIYEKKNGVYDGQSYDFIQRNLRGNHVALVDEGRSGSDVAVLDRLKFTFDSKDINMPDMTKPDGEAEDLKNPEGTDTMENEMEKENVSNDNEGMNLEMVCNALRDAVGYMEKMMTNKNGTDVDWNKEGMTGDTEPKDFVKKADITDDSETEKSEKEEAKDEEAEKESKQSTEKGMDSKAIFREISQRDALAARLSQHIGTFDHKEKTLDEVASYGVRKLGLTCKKGHEQSVLQGFLAAAKISTAVVGQDSAPRSNLIEEFLKGAK